MECAPCRCTGTVGLGWVMGRGKVRRRIDDVRQQYVWDDEKEYSVKSVYSSTLLQVCDVTDQGLTRERGGGGLRRRDHG